MNAIPNRSLTMLYPSFYHNKVNVPILVVFYLVDSNLDNFL
jgi:hypothetical protein